MKSATDISKQEQSGRVEFRLYKAAPGVPIPPTAKSNLDGNVRWLKDADLLPCDLERARILLFGYNTPVDEGRPPSLTTLTKGLRSCLINARQNCKNRPIIFIGHDFGITVIEKFLMECATDPSLVVGICKVTAGVLFFATPTQSTSKGDQDMFYFNTLETRLAPKGKIKYIEVLGASFLDDHLRKFKGFATWLARLRPAMALHLVQSDGKIAGKDAETYRKVLNIITELLKVYRLLDAADEGDQNRVDFLLKEDPNPNLQDSAKQSALHIAVRKNHTQVVRLLLSNGADVSLQNDDGMTALHFAVTSNPKTGAIIEILLDKEADIDARNTDGYSVLDLAEQAGINPNFLKKQNLMKGPSEDVSRRKPVPPIINSAVAACRELQATLAEFYLIDGQEHYIIQRPCVYELLYERGPDEIMAPSRKRELENLKPRCRWYHLPANHIGWVNDLFARMDIVPDSTKEEEHHGTTLWGRYMRPKARIFKPVQYSKTVTGAEQSKECAGKNFVLYIPFLNVERTCDMLDVYKIDERHSEFLGEKFASVQRARVNADDSESARSSNAAPSGKSTHGPVAEQTSTGGMPTRRQNEDSTLNRKKRGSSSASSDYNPLDIDKLLLRGHLWNELRKPGELHIRRTLDQSHYFMLNDTSDRDRGQVVVHQARHSQRDSIAAGSVSSDSETDDNEKYEDETRPTVVVDQLWLWVIGDMVVTSFPQKFRQPNWQLDGDVAEQLRVYLKYDKKRAPITSAHDLANLIITYCVGVFNRNQWTGHGFSLRDYLERSVGVIVDTERRKFRAFEDGPTEDLNEIREKRKKKGRKDKKRDKKRRNNAEISDDEEDFFDIRKEISLLDKAKVIRDKIRMILTILNDQALAMEDIVKIFQPDTPDPNPSTTFNKGTTKAPTRSDVITTPYKERHPLIDANIRDFDRILSHANTSYEALIYLLDIKQRQANTLEARLTRRGADAAAKQSNTIMVFTLATIVFGSLSFAAAFFALNVTVFPKLADGITTTWNLGHIVGYVSGVSLALSLPFIVIAFMINPIADTVWPRNKARKGKARKGIGLRSKWSRAVHQIFNILIGSWFYNLPYFRKWKYSDSCSYQSSHASYRRPGLPRRLWRSFRGLFAALIRFACKAAANVGLISARKPDRIHSIST